MSKSKKIMSISAKCRDLCFIQILNSNNEVLFERDDYVPDWLPGDHYGDYIMLDIDCETGQILNWKQPTFTKYLSTKLKTGVVT